MRALEKNKTWEVVTLNVLKTGPDRPVQPSIGRISSLVCSIKPFGYWTSHKPPKPAVEPDGSKQTEQFKLPLIL